MAITRMAGARKVNCIDADFASVRSIRTAAERIRHGIASQEFDAPSAIVANARVLSSLEPVLS
jgi:hypothetical protein